MNERIVRSRGGAAVASPFKRFLMIFAFVVLAVAVLFSYRVFNEKSAEYNQKKRVIEELNEQIAIEDNKSEKLKERDDKVTTDEDIEAIARQELGLIKKDEIVIRPN